MPFLYIHYAMCIWHLVHFRGAFFARSQEAGKNIDQYLTALGVLSPGMRI